MQDTEFVIFVVVYMLIIGIVSSIFNPGIYYFGEEDFISAEEVGYEEHYEDASWYQPILDFFGGTFNMILNIFAFLWACLTLNIEGVPWVVKILLCSPMYGGMGYIIAKLVRGGG